MRRRHRARSCSTLLWAVKFYVPEELREEALGVPAAAESGRLELVASNTLQPEFFNALWWKHRRDELSRREVREGWEQLVADRPASLYAPEDLSRGPPRSRWNRA